MLPAEFQALRMEMGWSQADTARELGIEVRTVGRYERGEREIPGPVIVALRCMARLRACGCSDAQK